MQDVADVLVIGSGAAGGALTWRLAEHGVKVVCLEQGGWIDPASFPSARPDYETQLTRGDFNFDPNIRNRPEDYPVIKAGGYPPDVLMFNAVGGTTIHWQGHFPRFHPSDFKMKSLDGVGDDWPISYQDLEPYYDLNDTMIGVSGLAGDPANPPRSPRPTPPLPIGKMGTTLVKAFEKLGWHWWVSDQAIISKTYKNRPGCMLHGKCMFGCPIAAKASTDRTYWPLSLERGAVLKTWCRVKEITVNKKGEVDGALYFEKDTLHEIKAKVVVVSCNGVGTPRLLLNSKSSLFPNGLANTHGVVGRYFMIHPTVFVTGTFEEELDGHLGPMGNPLMSQEFYETDTARGFVRGYSLIAERTFGPLSQTVGVPWGKDHHRTFKKIFPHQAGVSAYIDDLPEPENRVELSDEKADSNGIPAAKVTYTLGENSKKILDHALQKAKEVIETAGGKENFVLPISNGAHLMGTARMGTDPNRSVVNASNQAHEIKNLFIVDGSSFTTAAGVNPTSTIMALALRVADKIWEMRNEWN